MMWIEDRLGNWTVKYRWRIIFLTLPAVGLAGVGIRNLTIDNDTRVFFSEKNPQYQALKALENTFSKEQSVAFIVAPKDGNVFTRQTLAAITELLNDPPLTEKLGTAGRARIIERFDRESTLRRLMELTGGPPPAPARG